MHTFCSILNKHKFIFQLLSIKLMFVEKFLLIMSFPRYWKNDPNKLWLPFCDVYLSFFMMYEYGTIVFLICFVKSKIFTGLHYRDRTNSCCGHFRSCEAAGESERRRSTHAFWVPVRSSCWASWQHVCWRVSHVSHAGQLIITPLRYYVVIE